MSNTRNRRKQTGVFKRMATKVTGAFTRPKNHTNLQPEAAPKPRSAKRITRTSTGILKTRGNRRRENPVLVVLLWVLPMAAALAAFATPFLGGACLRVPDEHRSLHGPRRHGWWRRAP